MTLPLPVCLVCLCVSIATHVNVCSKKSKKVNYITIKV